MQLRSGGQQLNCPRGQDARAERGLDSKEPSLDQTLQVFRNGTKNRNYAHKRSSAKKKTKEKKAARASYLEAIQLADLERYYAGRPALRAPEGEKRGK